VPKVRHYKKIYARTGAKESVSKILRIALFAFAGFVVAVIALFAYYAKDLPRPERFTEAILNQPTKIYDRTGTVLLYQIYGEEKRDVVSLDQVSPLLKQAIIATEDANFYHHFGLDPKGVARAMLVNFKLRSPVEGGSTISQQLIRSSLLTNRKTLGRKIQEVILTLELERSYSKDKILGFYLNQIPFGSNAYGVEAASQFYFRKKAADLSLTEAASLAAMIRAPSYYSPYGPHKDKLLARTNYVLDRMAGTKFITKQGAQSAKNTQLVFASPSIDIKAPHFVLSVTDDLANTYGEDFLRENGLRVTTTLDWNLQQLAEKAVDDFAQRNASFNAYNASIVAIDPRTGEILAMVGSKDWFGESYPAGCTPGVNCLFDPKVNVATRIPGRQPGSAFKPFAYVTAFTKGFNDKTIVVDEQTDFGIWGGQDYAPQNYDGKFRGPVTLRQALAQSLNIPSIKVLLDLAGLNDSIKTARDAGLTTIKDDPSSYGPALVLGGGEVRLLDLVSAYGVFAAGGQRIPPVSILKTEDARGNIIQQNTNTPIRILSSEPVALITNILSDNEARSPIFGPNSPLYFPGQQVAVKTGTTQDYRDGWIVGYTPTIVAGVWVGNNDNTSMNKEPGVVVAGPIWHEFMRGAFVYSPSSTP